VSRPERVWLNCFGVCKLIKSHYDIDVLAIMDFPNTGVLTSTLLLINRIFKIRVIGKDFRE
jgi:hypothetical protein